jgi:hypothetical protein
VRNPGVPFWRATSVKNLSKSGSLASDQVSSAGPADQFRGTFRRNQGLKLVQNTQQSTQSWYKGFQVRAASVGGTRRTSPRQQKEVIQVAHTNVGSIASLGVLVGNEVFR